VGAGLVVVVVVVVATMLDGEDVVVGFEGETSTEEG
jgi:hypothetical protein